MGHFKKKKGVTFGVSGKQLFSIDKFTRATGSKLRCNTRFTIIYNFAGIYLFSHLKQQIQLLGEGYPMILRIV
jgi:hypothetical protein